MELQVYDSSFTQIAVIENYSSLIWTKRYCDAGDFEVVIPVGDEIPSWITDWSATDEEDYYVKLKEDPEEGYFMIFEKLELDQDSEDGTTLTLTGRSLHAILDRRVVWASVTYESKTTAYILKQLLTNAIISPSLAIRKIDNFTYTDPDSSYEFSTVTAEYFGNSIMDSIFDLCTEDDYGFRVLYDTDNQIFTSEMYKGTDHSYDNTEGNSIIYFATEMNNISESNYIRDLTDYKNVILARGSSTSINYILGTVSGIARRELYYQDSDVSTKGALQKSASYAMSQNTIESLIEASTNAAIFEYGVDFVVGDIVTIQNDYGIEQTARITEIIFSDDSGGVSIYPTLKTITDSD